jgi:hypothetical protein
MAERSQRPLGLNGPIPADSRKFLTLVETEKPARIAKAVLVRSRSKTNPRLSVATAQDEPRSKRFRPK